MDYYETLGVAKSATFDEIKASYRKKAQENHPDKGGNLEDFQRIQAAYAVLGDPEKRAKYDTGGDLNEPSLRQKAVQYLVAAFNGVMGLDITEHFDLVGTIRKHVEVEFDKANGHLSMLQRERRKVGVVRKRLHSDGDRVLMEVIRAKRRDLWRAYRATQGSIVVIEAAGEILGDYSFDFTEQPNHDTGRTNLWFQSFTRL